VPGLQLLGLQLLGLQLPGFRVPGFRVLGSKGLELQLWRSGVAAFSRFPPILWE
jgi:hypothetical protein